MESIYRSTAGQQEIGRWCVERLDSWAVPHERTTLAAGGARTHVVTAGPGPGADTPTGTGTSTSTSTVVFVPGTNFNAAASLPLAAALVRAGHRVVTADVPGQPGLSSGARGLSGGRLAWYGAWLDDVLETTGPAVVMGHSFGAAIALSCRSPHVERRLLLSPGGFCALRLTPGLLAASAAWYLSPGPARSGRLLRSMTAPGVEPRAELVQWLTLVARHSRSSGAPGRAAFDDRVRAVPHRVVSGAHDVFLPPRRLAPAVRAALGADLEVVPHAGHLLVDEAPDDVAALV
ncbi:alpha/beta fold hydrolase [Streptomyces sp. NRRL S-87]|uniref:alpha/beta fold hydrolase n=1 Tax=Streptomyces sp. NRRL S-87 TaxID=1463920 RepID=UPI0004BE5E4E|nr:alpha/beta hydrolase [Streptomyces sp. NRRL S-87]